MLENFFHAGGHSLLAMSLIAKVNRSFAVSLTLGMLFEAPTVANLADHVRRERGDVRQPSDRAAPDVTITVMHDPSRRP